MFQSTQDLTVSKLIILFLLQNVKKMTQTQITDFILYKNYIDYFSLQQYLSEIVTANLIDVEKTDNTTYYQINNKGITTLDLFGNRIPFSVRQEIIEYSKNNLIISPFTKIDATINTTSENECFVECFINENDKTVIELTLKADDNTEAKRIRMNWLKHAQSLYKTIKKDLSK